MLEILNITLKINTVGTKTNCSVKENIVLPSLVVLLLFCLHRYWWSAFLARSLFRAVQLGRTTPPQYLLSRSTRECQLTKRLWRLDTDQCAERVEKCCCFAYKHLSNRILRILSPAGWFKWHACCHNRFLWQSPFSCHPGP